MKKRGPKAIDRAHAKRVGARLARAIPDPICELRFESPWQLLVSTMLAAQSTDATVNKVAPDLFRAYPTPRALADAPQEDVERLVYSTGFFRQKTKAIQAASRKLVEAFDSVVPRDIDELVTLPGVARKTANVVIGVAYGIATGIAVDTHVCRVARRLELTTETDPDKVEAELVASYPRKDWIAVTHRMVLHGRYVCLAKEPACESCPLNELCPASEKKPKGRWGARADAERALVDAKLGRSAAPSIEETIDAPA
jgi:endonuclease-3